MAKECTIIDNETGEILCEDFKIDTTKDKQRKLKGAEKSQLSKEFKVIQSDYLDDFIFYIFKNMNELEKILNDNYLVKFLYCCSYIKNNGALMFDDNITYIKKKDLKQLLKVGEKTFRQFYNLVIEKQFIKEQDDELYVNLDICWRGSKKKYENLNNKKLKDFTRIYIKTIREVYENIPSRQHKRISIIYKLIPYTNWQYNILCNIDTIEEINKNKINPLTIGDIMSILKYDKTHITRFKKDFYSLKYKNYNVFGTVQFEADYLKSFIIVNPLFFYRGNDPKELNYLITLFGLSKLEK